ncbi:MAG: Alpha-L-Rha alpha,3-L-rhamnosyltransferase [Pseudomonas sp.]|jgi:rhamnosyltransferase|uniref:glycosyltransferase n=1 Tax=Pseudomonas sp. TaxID=306 RepID=UPI0026138D1D|nr:glycosyltransferase [Pseudomonas sp.]MDB6047657.1 Alpha-L-Rha alpha,3-L-rhamnosyltransferase [Pseudomonas sp.]
MSTELLVPRFAVLLSAYNGIKWLEPQVRTIIAQRAVRVTIFVSIDQSSDATEDWIKHNALINTNIVVLPVGERFGGAAKNFFRLIRDVDFKNFDYLSFADQDDIWLEDKLITAHEKIVEYGVSGYSGNVTAFWPDGREYLIDKAQQQKKYDFLFEAAGPGCTYVLKIAQALSFKEFLVRNWTFANGISLHDWLIYAWFRSNGLKWYIDPVPKMLYRQHNNNQVGANSGIKALVARVNLLRTGWYRQEIWKIAFLLGDKIPGLPNSLSENGKIPRRFLFTNAKRLRRRFRDQIFLLVIVALGIY